MVRQTLALAWLLLSGAAAWAETKPHEVERGRALYLDGRHADGRLIQATTGDAAVPLPPAFLACVNCHGYDARGKTEGGVTTSDLRWATLAGPYEFVRADGRRRAPYDEARFFTALTLGRDASGRPLDPAMPRYDFSSAEAADLAAYLRQVDRATGEGVTDDTLRLGLALPDNPAAPALATADRRWVEAWFEAVNRRGGIFRRRIELVAVDPSGDSVASPLLAVLDADAARPPAKAAWARQRLPFLSVTAEAGPAASRYAFALFPSLAEQARVLVRYALAHDAAGSSRVAAVYPAKPGPSTEGSGVLAAVQPVGPVIPMAFVSGTGDAAVRAWREGGVGSVLLLGGSGDLGELIPAARRADWDPLWLWTETPVGAETGRRAVGVRPAVDADVSAEARARSGQGGAADRVTEAGRARRWALLGAAQVLVAALENAGREVGREKLVASLESLQAFSSGFTRPGGFSPRSHTLISGMYVVPLTAATSNAGPEWVSLGE